MKNSDTVIELQALCKQDDASAWVSDLWSKWNNQRQEVVALWNEVEQYVFATDTSKTAGKSLPWTHNSRVPKLTQIRDNLHANYLSSLFPNDKWLTWVAHSKDSAVRDRARTITSYMENKTREGGFKNTVSRLIYDYIDKGVCFSQPTFEARYKTGPMGDKVTAFVGPTAVRIDPRDIVFNPTAANFRNTSKVVRSLVTLGELRKLAMTQPDQDFWNDVLERREALYKASLRYDANDWSKAEQYAIDGFGNLQEYYMSDTVEILEFYGDYHDAASGELTTNRMITVVDRSYVARDIEIPTYGGEAPIFMAGWRYRPNNLWAQGPLDNLVGMQYQIDHYLNMAANALDLKVMPPIKVIGDVEAFDWAPRAEIHMDENGDVQEMAQQYGDISTVMSFIAELENRMEMYAGAPREAMGIRTPGEKTAFEVQALENAAGRIFQEKTIQFELFMEELLNGMLEEAHRNMDYLDVVRVIDTDYGAVQFKQITKEDIIADGILRPVGARHFAQKAQELQNVVGIFNSPIGQMIAPHVSAVSMANFVADVVDLRGYDLIQQNVAILEQQEMQALAQQAEQDNMVRSQTSVEEIEMNLAKQDVAAE